MPQRAPPLRIHGAEQVMRNGDEIVQLAGIDVDLEAQNVSSDCTGFLYMTGFPKKRPRLKDCLMATNQPLGVKMALPLYLDATSSAPRY